MTRLAIIIAAVLALGACTHPSTPEGHEGYVWHKPLLFGQAEYRDMMRGPASTGVSWRLYVINVDMRAKSYKEDFELLTGDNLQISFEVNARVSLRPQTVRELVEQWGGADWYEWNVREPLRTIVRHEVTEVSALQIQLKTDMVRQRIYDQLVAKYEGTPIQIESVDVGNIRFPEKVTDAISRKIGQQQELERQEYLLQQTQKEAAIRVLEALKAAKQQQIISSTLDPLYVQRMAVQVYKKLAASRNETTIVLPNTSDGTAMPRALTSSKSKVLSPADEKLLEQMEERYMKMARDRGAEPNLEPAADAVEPPPAVPVEPPTIDAVEPPAQ